MRRSRILVGLALVPLLALFERLAHYSTRMTISQLLQAASTTDDFATPAASIARERAMLMGIAALSTLLGGALAMVIGARRTLLLSAVLIAVACAAMAFATPESTSSVGMLWAVASGLFLVNVFPLAAELLAEARPMTLAALYAGTALAVNVGSFGGPLLSGLLHKLPLAATAIVDSIVMALIAGALAVLMVLDRDPTAPVPAPPRPALAALLLVAVIVPHALIADLPPVSSTTGSPDSLALKLLASGAAQLVVVVAIIALAAVRSRISLLIPLGIGLLLSALSGALWLADAHGVAEIVSTAGAHLAEPMKLSLIASIVPRRYAPGVFALWMTLPRFATSLSTMGSSVLTGGSLAIGTIGCVVVGGALLIRRRAVDASLIA